MGLAAEFSLYVGQFRSTHACASWIAALRHKPVDHAVKHNAVIKAFARKRANPLNMARGKVRAELDNDIAAINGQGKGFGHELSPSFKISPWPLGCCGQFR